MASIIPEVLNHFNIYNGANALVGVSGEVELPELEAMTSKDRRSARSTSVGSTI